MNRSWQQSTSWHPSTFLDSKEDTFLAVFKLKNAFMKMLCKWSKTDCPFSHDLVVIHSYTGWPCLDKKILRERRKYRACLCGQKMDVIPLFCPWLEATEMLFQLLFPPGSGPDLPIVPYPKETSNRSQISKIHPASLISSMSVILTLLETKEQDQ